MKTPRAVTTVSRLILFFVVAAMPCLAPAQVQDTSSEYMSLDQCVDYALHHQPALNQAQLGVAIARATNMINLSGWLPQVTLSGNLTHYVQTPTTFSRSDSLSTPVATHTGIANTFLPQLTVSQTVFNPQLLFAGKAAPLYVKGAEQITDSTRINVITTVTKSFYNLLLTLEQIKILKEDTARLDRNVKDTYHQFVGGIVDETDYDEAVISLNNSTIQLKQQMENVTPQYAYLKQLMGYPSQQQFNVVFDTAQMMREITADTTETLDYGKRIEYKQLITAREIQRTQTNYYRLAFLPTISAFYNYYHEFESNSTSDLFTTAYPYSFFGLSLNMPIFTGFSHVASVRRSRLQEQVIDWAEVELKSRIYTEYTTALANYKSGLFNWVMLKDNVVKAQNVYRIVSLQYKQGIVAYLNMIVAESNLIAAETGSTNALFQLLSSKVDLERAMGNVSYNSITR